MFLSLGLGGLSLKELGRRVYNEIMEDDVLGRSAQLSYYFLLALFPALLFLTSVLGAVAGEDSQLRSSLFGYLSTVLPKSAYDLVSENVKQVIESSGGGKISFGILATLWAASSGMGAISSTLNIAYDVEEGRSWWKARLVAIGLTIALALLIITALVLILFGHDLAEWVAAGFGLGGAFELTWKIVQWPLVLLFVLLAFALIYYFAPDVRQQSWKFITPGSIIGVALWLIVSFVFKTYLSYFGNYNATYGSLGAVIILMLWFYFTGLAILVGGEINSEIEHALAERGVDEAKEEGEKRADGSTEPSDASARREAKADEGRRALVGAALAGANDVRARPKRGRARAYRVDHEGFSFGKLAVVMGAWVLAKIGLKPTVNKER